MDLLLRNAPGARIYTFKLENKQENFFFFLFDCSYCSVAKVIGNMFIVILLLRRKTRTSSFLFILVTAQNELIYFFKPECVVEICPLAQQTEMMRPDLLFHTTVMPLFNTVVLYIVFPKCFLNSGLQIGSSLKRFFFPSYLFITSDNTRLFGQKSMKSQPGAN